MIETPPKRGRFQFGLRTWFVTVAILAVTMPCWSLLVLATPESTILAVPAAFFWFLLYKQLRSGAIFAKHGNPWQREQHPDKFGCAVVVTLTLAILFSLLSAAVFQETIGRYFAV